MTTLIKLDVDKLMTFLPTDYTHMNIANGFKQDPSPVFDINIKTLLENYNNNDRKVLYELLIIEIKKHLISCDVTERSRFKNRLNYSKLELEKINLVMYEDVDFEIPDNLNKMQVRTKILLFNELGILNLLRKNESFKNNTNLSKLIAELISGPNDDVSKVYETVRTDLAYSSVKNNKKTPYSKPQISKVNSILTSFSLPIIK